MLVRKNFNQNNQPMETSNLMQYSANKFILLIRAVENIIEEEQAAVMSRRDMLNGEDLSEDFIQRQHDALKQHKTNLDELHELHVAFLTHYDIISKREKTLNQ